MQWSLHFEHFGFLLKAIIVISVKNLVSLSSFILVVGSVVYIDRLRHDDISFWVMFHDLQLWVSSVGNPVSFTCDYMWTDGQTERQTCSDDNSFQFTRSEFKRRFNSRETVRDWSLSLWCAWGSYSLLQGYFVSYLLDFMRASLSLKTLERLTSSTKALPKKEIKGEEAHK